MASFTLEDIKAAAEKKYGDLQIGEFTLLNALRLSKEKRKALMATQDRMDEESENYDPEVDQLDVLSDAIRAAAKTAADAEGILEFAGHDLSILATIFEKYSGETELGEASASES